MTDVFCFGAESTKAYVFFSSYIAYGIENLSPSIRHKLEMIASSSPETALALCPGWELRAPSLVCEKEVSYT